MVEIVSSPVRGLEGLFQRLVAPVGQIFRDYAGNIAPDGKTNASGNPEVVTAADREVSQLAIDFLNQAGFPVITEEHPEPNSQERTQLLKELNRKESYYVVDPIDGTAEFLEGLGLSALLVTKLSQCGQGYYPSEGMIVIPEREQSRAFLISDQGIKYLVDGSEQAIQPKRTIQDVVDSGEVYFNLRALFVNRYLTLNSAEARSQLGEEDFNLWNKKLDEHLSREYECRDGDVQQLRMFLADSNRNRMNSNCGHMLDVFNVARELAGRLSTGLKAVPVLTGGSGHATAVFLGGYPDYRPSPDLYITHKNDGSSVWDLGPLVAAGRFWNPAISIRGFNKEPLTAVDFVRKDQKFPRGIIASTLPVF